MALHVREGTDLTQAARRLAECAMEGSNRVNTSAGLRERLVVTAYLSWKDLVETQLRNVFTDPGVLSHLRTAAFWAIRDPAHQDFRISELVNSEVNEQVAWIEGLVGHLNCMAERLAAAPGVATVLDTNVLLHYQPPEQVEWAKVTGVDPVRLLLPLRVIEELDEKKYTARPDIRDRARRLLSDLWGRLAGTGGGPVQLRENVTIEVPVDEGQHRARPVDADEEILDTCEQVRNVASASSW